MKKSIWTGVTALSIALSTTLGIGAVAHADNLFQVAQKTPELSTFVKVAQAAGLDKDLSRADGTEFTVAAPVNSAFEKLPPGVLDKLLLPDNRKLLRSILFYHIAFGKYTAEILIKVAPGSTGNSIQGDILTITSLDPPKLNGSPVLKADIMGDNGVIHELADLLIPPTRKKDYEALGGGVAAVPTVVGLSEKEKSVIGVYQSVKDTKAPVIEIKGEGTQLTLIVKGLPNLPVTLNEKDQIVTMPSLPGYTTTAIREADGKVNGLNVVVPGDSGVFKRVVSETVPDIVGTITANPDFSTLVQLIKAAGLDKTLAETGPFTVLAPTNAAFAKIPKAKLDELQKPENKTKLVALLQKHVIGTKLLAIDIVKSSGKPVKALSGEVKFAVGADGKVKIGKAVVIKTDILATNGVIHSIDTVL
jgi:uncharacterized surface protein with fasciclin (FAS1) repeats